MVSSTMQLIIFSHLSEQVTACLQSLIHSRPVHKAVFVMYAQITHQNKVIDRRTPPCAQNMHFVEAVIQEESHTKADTSNWLNIERQQREGPHSIISSWTEPVCS